MLWLESNRPVSGWGGGELRGAEDVQIKKATHGDSDLVEIDELDAGERSMKEKAAQEAKVLASEKDKYCR